MLNQKYKQELDELYKILENCRRSIFGYNYPSYVNCQYQSFDEYLKDKLPFFNYQIISMFDEITTYAKKLMIYKDSELIDIIILEIEGDDFAANIYSSGDINEHHWIPKTKTEQILNINDILDHSTEIEKIFDQPAMPFKIRREQLEYLASPDVKQAIESINTWRLIKKDLSKYKNNKNSKMIRELCISFLVDIRVAGDKFIGIRNEILKNKKSKEKILYIDPILSSTINKKVKTFLNTNTAFAIDTDYNCFAILDFKYLVDLEINTTTVFDNDDVINDLLHHGKYYKTIIDSIINRDISHKKHEYVKIPLHQLSFLLEKANLNDSVYDFDKQKMRLM